MVKKFDENTINFLKSMDKNCQTMSEQYNDALLRARLENPDAELSEDDQGLMFLVTAFGIMYNKLVDLGHLPDVQLAPYFQMKSQS
jgi:hypothetical protein